MTGELPFPPAPKPRRPALRYHGSKWLLAPWIISHFPEHRVYVEPFGGGAGVLLRKELSRIEIYNDLDLEVVNLFRILRDPEQTDRLIGLLELTPFARVEFDLANEGRADLPLCPDNLELARRLVFRSFAGFGSHSHNAENANGFRWMTYTPYAKEWNGFPPHLFTIAARMRHVTIECRDALEIIPLVDAPDALFFLDPPYVQSSRNNGGKGYTHEMTDRDHRNLAFILSSLKGKAILCGYPSDLYDRQLYPSWRRVERSHYANGQSGKVARTEVLWLNF
jgi:DNA adenine methylase